MSNKREISCVESRVTGHVSRKGFSLPEVLMATGILAVGLVMIAGTFPVAIFLTLSSVEQTAAPIAADEAVAKMQLYGFAGISTSTKDFDSIPAKIDPNEYWYPSIRDINDYQRTYCWSAICRLSAPNLVQATIFVSRKGASGLSYYQYDSTTNSINPNGTRPTPVKITGATATGPQLTLSTPGDGAKYIHAGASIVADATGNIYRVLSRDNDTITLASNWIETANDFWVVPPPASGGRSPFVGVYQRIININ